MQKPRTISIDPPGARELDDAIAATPLPGGGWIVDVCLPDVPSLVPHGSATDAAARRLGVVTYSGTSTRVPMLPKRLVQSTSLSPDRDGPVVHVRLAVGPDGRASVLDVSRIMHRTAARLSYQEADRALADPDGPHHEEMRRLWDLTMVLHARRAAGTGARFDLASRTYTNEEGREMRMDSASAHRSNLIVMETMILANATLAAHAERLGLPILYRNHRLGDMRHGDRTRAVAELAQIEGIDRKEADARLRSMMQLLGPAEVGTEALGHFGLDLPAYAWFTSPLRRYVDVVNLRALLDAHRDPDLEGLASWLTQIHRTQKQSNSEHHGRVSRALIIGHLRHDRQDELRMWRIHTILRALEENPDHDARRAVSHIAMRMAGDELSGKDIATLVDTSEALFGREVHERVLAWIEEDDGRIERLHERRMEMARMNGDDADADAGAEMEAMGADPQPATHPAIRSVPRDDADGVNHKGVLLERAMAAGASVDYDRRTSGPPHAPVFTVSAVWNNQQRRLTSQGVARTVKAAEQQASRAMIDMLGEVVETASPIDRAPAPELHPKSALLEMAQVRKELSLRFGEAVREGSHHAPTFSVGVRIDDGRGSRTFVGRGGSKKEAEREASRRALDWLLQPG